MSGAEPLLPILMAGAQIVSEINQSQAAARNAAHSARMAEQQSALAQQYAHLEEQRRRDQTRGVLARQTARFAKAGITVEGTPLDVTLEAEADGELAALSARHGGLIDAYRYDNEAAAARREARSARLSGYVNVGSTILKGAKQFIGGPLG